ncbi:MAG: deoxyribose-phosphate aldolase [Synergistaceae bacterium]|jgi:deoxyribose-phosphate aldolase|nr:deoxyribose-phosphate aldolase [Synergistaceae bacterium]
MAVDFTKINENNIGKLFDPSVLPKNSTKEEIISGAKDAVKYNTMSFVVSSPYYVPEIVPILAGSTVIPCSCIAFPFGATTAKVKALETEEAYKLGARAFDLVMNIGALQDGNFKVVQQELKDFKTAAQGAVTKVIMDIEFLTDKQIADGTKMIVEAGIDYAKTSSGQFTGPTLEQFIVMRDVCKGTKTKTKVAGVKFPRPQNAYVFLMAGADLIGTRAAVPMINALPQMRELGLVPQYKG